MKGSSRSHKRVSEISRELSEITDAYGASAEELIGIYAECWDHSEDYQWNRMCSVYPALQEATKHDRDRILDLLSRIRGEEKERKFRRKAYFEKDGKLYLEILTTDGEYKFAYQDDDGQVNFVDIVDDIIPVELPITADGERAGIVKMPDEGIATCRLLEPRELLEKIKRHISKYCDMPELDRDISSYYALFSWFWMKVNTRPYLRFIADTGKGKSRMQEVVGDLCFYPTTAGGSGSFSGMFRIHQLWRGTLIIDEADTREGKDAKAIKYLNLGFQDGKWFVLSDKKNPRRQEVFNPAGPKVISMREHFRDNALESRLISITTHETTNENIKPLLDAEYEAETRELRNEIARFVLAHWQDVDGNRLIDFTGLGLEPRLRQLAMPISVIFQLWPEGEEEFKEYIQARQKELKKDRAMSFEGSLFNFVYALAAGDEDVKDDFSQFYDGEEIQAVTPSIVAKAMNTTPRAATEALRSIGFEIERRWIAHQEEIDKNKWETKRRYVRAYVVPDGRTWREMVQRYYYREDDDDPGDIEIPQVLRSRRYVDMDGVYISGSSGSSGSKVQHHNKGEPDEPDEPDINTHTLSHNTEEAKNHTGGKRTRVVNIKNISEDGSIPREAYDNDFQARQAKEAKEKLEEAIGND